MCNEYIIAHHLCQWFLQCPRAKCKSVFTGNSILNTVTSNVPVIPKNGYLRTNGSVSAFKFHFRLLHLYFEGDCKSTLFRFNSLYSSPNLTSFYEWRTCLNVLRICPQVLSLSVFHWWKPTSLAENIGKNA